MNTNSFCSVCGQNMQIKVLNPHCLGDAKADCPYSLPKMIFEVPKPLIDKLYPDTFKYIPTGEIYDCFGDDEGYYWAEDPDDQFKLLKFDPCDCEEVLNKEQNP